MNGLLHRDLLKIGKLKINKQQLFGSLSLEQENKITQELTNYILWTSYYEKYLIDYFSSKKESLYDKDNKINLKLVTEFWLQVIGKSKELKELINSVEIVQNVYEYINIYYDDLLFITKSEINNSIHTENKELSFQEQQTIINKKPIYFDYRMISQKNFREEKQKEELFQIMKSNKRKEMVILDYFKRKFINLDHIDKITIQKLIDKYK